MGNNSSDYFLIYLLKKLESTPVIPLNCNNFEIYYWKQRGFTHLKKLNVNHEICETSWSWKEESLFFPNLLIFYFANMLINWIFTISKWTYIKWKLAKLSCSVISNSLRPHGLQSAIVLYPWDFPGKNTEVGCHFLLQGIFPTQGSNLSLPHCGQTLYCLSHQGSPKWKWNLVKLSYTYD